MLTARVRPRSTRAVVALIGVLGACLVFGACLMLGATPATAAPASAAKPRCDVRVGGGEGRLIRTDCREAGSTTAGRGSGGPAAPTCELVGAATYCLGSQPCYVTAHVVPWAPPAGPSPGPGATWGLRNCLSVLGTLMSTTPVWIGGPVVPPLVVQAQNAVGRLRLPKPAIVTDPRVRAIVNLETRFAPAQVPPQPLRGSAALGLVAVATPSRWVVTPGDGASPLSCAVPVTTACRYTYERSSAGAAGRDSQGLPAYRATGFLRWAVTYELNGDPVTIDGAPTTVAGPTVALLLPVAEIQSLVVTGR